MFFYISLLIGSVVAAVLLLYFFHAIRSLSSAAYKSMLPSAKDRRTGHLENTKFSDNSKMQTPWGWRGHASPAGVARTHPAVPSDHGVSWEWKAKGNKTNNKSQAEKPTGLNGFLASEATPKPAVGWPYREDKLDAAGSAYKVTRRAKPARTNLRDNGKPWGW